MLKLFKPTPESDARFSDTGAGDRFTRFEHSHVRQPAERMPLPAEAQEPDTAFTRFKHRHVRKSPAPAPAPVTARVSPGRPERQAVETVPARPAGPGPSLAAQLYSDAPITTDTLRRALPLRFAGLTEPEPALAAE